MLQKILAHIKVNLNLLAMNKSEGFPFKYVLIYSMKCSRMFDLLFSATLDNEDDILYKCERNEETDLLLDCLEFSTPKDPNDHKKRLVNGKFFHKSIGLDNMNYYIAVADKGFKDKGFFVQVTEAMSWAFFYKNKDNL